MSRQRESRRVLDAQIRSTSRAQWIDVGFFVAAGALAVWFALLLLGNSIHLGWSLVLLVPFWAVTAYLTLPRLHRILTSLYVPDYFFGRTRTSEGMLGDPVNLAVDGTAAQIHAAMTAAGWTLADPVNLRTSWRIVVSSVLGRSYPEAPVSPLFLFGRMQDLAYQQEVEGSPSQRHHVRFWRCPDDWPLPGGRRVGWLGAGTFDTAVGLSLFTLQVTHRIDENIDVERDYIVDSVRAVPGSSIDVIREFSSGYHHRNGGGDRVRTDGDLPVIDVGGVRVAPAAEVPAMVAEAAAGFAVPDGPVASPDPDARVSAPSQVHAHRPPKLMLALVMLMASFLGQCAMLAWGFVRSPEDVIGATGESDQVNAAAFVIFLSAWAAGLVILTALTLAGRAWPRIALMALLTAGLFLQLRDGRAGDAGTITVHLVTAAVSLVALLAISSDEVRQWTQNRRPGKGRRSGVVKQEG
ncbi:LssY C-terminal domain-containing protein [Corynebacterium sp. NPDC060344]|uniref:LssY C-terminal domain-containing protein n=1 Tax=Corynebacterium sp. NPDC060344 TaxID=3347101 RepID=UPI003666DF8F